MSSVMTKVLGDLRRRRLQAAVIALVIFLASGTTTLGLTLLQTASHAWDRAFEAQKGAHLTVHFDRHKVDSRQLAGTPALIGASASAGPWPLVYPAAFALGTHKYRLNTVGRDSAQADVEILPLVAGRWVEGPGEIVVTRAFADFNHVRLGDRLLSLGSLEKPPLVVVGEALDIDEGGAELSTQSAWVAPSQLPLLAPDWGYTMVYRFPQAPTTSEVTDKVARLEASLPPGAVQYSLDYSAFKLLFNITNQLVVTFLLAFGIFALLACAATVANLVSGIVVASYREIGVMKAVGFTPLQVVGTLVGQMLVPALAGCVLGIPAGVALSIPLVERAAASLALPSEPPFAPAMALATLLLVTAVVLVAAVLPGLRAGRLSAVGAMSLGSAPSGGRRSSVGSWLRRLPLPRPLALGSGDAFARPQRAALTVLAVLVGVTTLVFASGLRTSMQHLFDTSDPGGLSGNLHTDVTVQRSIAYPDQKVMVTLAAQPETDLIIGGTRNVETVPGVAFRPPGVGGLSGPTRAGRYPVWVIAYRGDSARLGIPVIRGRWFSAPGEVVAPRAILEASHLKVGDRFQAVIRGRPIELRVVGEIFSTNLGDEIDMDLSTLASAAPGVQPTYYFVKLKPGSDAEAYARRVQATEPDFLDASANRIHGSISPVDTLNSVMLVLAAVLALIAVAGVFNTLLLNTRERARETAVLKALGMTPLQVMAMVAASAVLLGSVGGVLGLPAGVAVHRALMQALASLTGNDLPDSFFRVFSAPGLIVLALAGVAVALVGSLLPARWAARTRVAEVLHSE
jgi:putative ABC transport system permease protein